jgi:hypothetical protein
MASRGPLAALFDCRLTVRLKNLDYSQSRKVLVEIGRGLTGLADIVIIVGTRAKADTRLSGPQPRLPRCRWMHQGVRTARFWSNHSRR